MRAQTITKLDGRASLVAGALAAIAAVIPGGSAHAAGLSQTFTVTNDYDYRGVSQTAEDSALQASVDYVTESGLYAGAWASNVEFGDATSIETDFYAGYSGTAGRFGYDAGIVWYTYDESVYNFPEAYVSGSIGPLKGKLSYSPEFAGVNVDPGTLAADRESESAFYAEGNLSFALNDTFSVLVHAGYSFGDYWEEAGELASLASGQSLDGEYLDYFLGLGATFGKFSTALKFIDTGGDLENDASKIFNNDRRVILSIATTFPWE